MKTFIGVTLVACFGLVLLLLAIGPIGVLVTLVGSLFAALTFAPMVIRLEEERESQSLHESYQPLPVASVAGCD